jgi:hypothetical protein
LGGCWDDPSKEHTFYLTDYDFERLGGGLMPAYAVGLGVGRAETLVPLTCVGCKGGRWRWRR